MTDFLVKLFIKNRNDIHDPQVRKKYGSLGGIVGIICNIILFTLKFLAGVLTSSISITADAFNNLSDAGSSIITLVGFKMASMPSDDEHPFGHGRIEYVSGLIVSLIIMLMGVELFKSSVEKIISPETITFQWLSLGILIFSILLKLWMALFNRRLGKKINSVAMQATAADSLSDVIATTAVVIGILVFYFFHLNIDGWIGVVVALFILYTGFTTARDTMNSLLGQAPDAEFV
ncbi:MAG: cation transporter, partial [Clostridiales bacterium]|nr:cation transporter [Clostridiales bacterium]